MVLPALELYGNVADCVPWRPTLDHWQHTTIFVGARVHPLTKASDPFENIENLPALA
jgi:hypothetical protein